MNWQRFHSSASIALLRTLLFCVNIVFMISGIILVLLGLILRGHIKELVEITPEMNSSSPYVLFGLGLSIFFIGLFAFWCTIKGQITLLYIYSIVILLIFIVEILLAITILMKKRTYEETFKTAVRKMMHEYPRRPTNSYVDHLQRTLSCCGIDSFTDWFETPYGNVSSQVPVSCCNKSLNHTCIRQDLKKDNLSTDINKNGCFEAVISVIKNNYPIFGGIILAIALFPLIGIVLAYCLARQMRKCSYEQVN